jgi:hypothetical protein
MKRQARHLLILSASLWVLSVMFPLVSTAWADVNGNCGATFKGVDIKGRGTSSAGDAIDVDNNEVVNVNMTSPAGFTSHKVDLEIAGVSRTVSNQTDAGDTQWSDTVNVKDYAWMGVGLYTVTGSATLSDGSTCSGSALINVSGFPLTTVAGGAAAAATLVGLAAVATTSVVSASAGATASGKIEDWVGNQLEKQAKQVPPPEPEWTVIDEIMWHLTGPFGPCLIMAIPGLLLTVGAMATPQSQPSTGARSARRARWLPRITIAGVLGGLLGGLGSAVLLQQFAVAPLTRGMLIECLIGGVIIGIALPSIGRLWSVMQVNAAMSKAEQRLRAATPKAGPPPQSTPEPPQP